MPWLTRLQPFPQPSLITLRHPIVLMHGFGMVAGLGRRGPLHDEALHLRTCGVDAFAPNVIPYQTVPERAAHWEKRIAHVRATTGADAVNLIAHSTGGLDARYLISRRGLHEVVASLTTVSTPHRGTSLARIALDLPPPLRNGIVRLIDAVAARTLGGTDNDLLTALAELTPAYLTETFNPSVPDHPSVTYWSYAAAAGRGAGASINPYLALSNYLIYRREGPNDGIVPAESARWGTFLGILDSDHGQTVGISGVPGRAFRSKAFYRSIAERLATAGF